ncbi:hypothetical protein M1N90_00735 [Dehalococcoidia bacterium]|nr:hypothetical protein [Dehalococcoidia bacterium]
MFAASPNPKIASPIPTIENILDTFQDNATAIEDARAMKSSLVALIDTGMSILPVP